MTNRDLYFRDPITLELLNNGVSKVSEIGHDAGQIKTLRFELQNFVCDGEYARGLERILNAYLGGLAKAEQNAVWVSGFFGSGKSHLVKVLRYLWEDYRFADGATARSIVTLPAEITSLLTELSNRSKPMGGLRAAAGTLGAGSMDNVRLAFIQLVLRAAGLPETLAQAKFILWLRSSGLEAKVEAALKQQNRELGREVLSLKLSVPLADALVTAEPKYATAANAQAAIREQFRDNNSPTIDDALDIVKQIFGHGGQLPCTLLVVDEIQQFIGDKIQRANDVQEIAEHVCTDLGSRLLFVGTGQAALHTATPTLQRLQARFAVKVQLSDTDVESVIRKTVLRKKPEQESAIAQCMAANQGELARHLQSTRLAATHEDDRFFVADYPLLPTRRRFWEKVLRNTDHSGTKAQLRSQLQIVFEATRQTASAALGSVVPADFIYDQISTDLLNSGELEREYDDIIRKQRDGSADGDLRSSLCALIFLIGKLPRTPGADDGVRSNPETLVDLLINDLKIDRPRLEQQVPKQLKHLVDTGQLMAVETEYHLQTREGAVWTHEFNRRRTSALNDDARINGTRAELLRDGLKQALKPVSLQQGHSGTSRKLTFDLSSSRPAASADDVSLWVRDGWSDDEKSVLNDARAAGVDSPLLFGYLPRQHHEELKQAIASQIAAQETLDAHGMTGGAETIEPRKAVETHRDVARMRIQSLLGQVIGGVKVFLGGGQEANGIELADKVQDSADSALVRLFPQFSEADHANWGQVVSKARAGDVAALSQVGFPGNPTQNAEAFEFFDPIVGEKKAYFETAGALGEGERIWVMAKMPGAMEIVPGDECLKYLLLSNTHSGDGSVIVKFTSVRVVCQNTLMLAMQDGQKAYRVRHSKKMQFKLDELSDFLAITQDVFLNAEASFRRLAQIEMVGDRLDSYLEAVFPLSATQKKNGTQPARWEFLHQIFESAPDLQLPKVRGTLWGAYNAITMFEDYKQQPGEELPEQRLNRTWFGSGADIKVTALDKAIELAGAWQ